MIQIIYQLSLKPVDNNFEMEEQGDTNTLFQESQVLWAKIRGYPWWPAFVSEVHSGDGPETTSYTVIFFGDNTNSRLGTSKLRKFLEYYATFYEKALKNKKLKVSIERAEERLQQNNENISIYERIRNRFKNKKRKNQPKSQSKISSQQKISAQDIPDINLAQRLVKTKSQPPARRGRKPLNRSLSKIQNKVAVNHSENNEVENMDESEEPKASPNKSLNISNQIQGNQAILPIRATRLRARGQAIKKMNSDSENQQEEEDEKSQQSNKKQLIRKATPSRRGRKGRPKKTEIIEKEISSESEKQFSDHSQKVRKNRILGKRKPFGKMRGRKPFAMRELLQQQNISGNANAATISPSVLRDVEKVREVLDRKQQLIKLLLSMNITTANIKQILDLGVTDILLDGAITKTVFLLLNSLKATLLHKYFPEDNKHRKKHEKLSKERRKIRYDENDNNSGKEQKENGQNNQSDEEDLQRKNEDEQYLSQYNEIRKKTVLKLEKMLKKLNIDLKDPKQWAIKIEKTFKQASIDKDLGYNKVAYEKMREIKDKLNSYQQSKSEAEQIQKYVASLIKDNEDDNDNDAQIEGDDDDENEDDLQEEDDDDQKQDKEDDGNVDDEVFQDNEQDDDEEQEEDEGDNEDSEDEEDQGDNDSEEGDQEEQNAEDEDSKKNDDGQLEIEDQNDQ